MRQPLVSKSRDALTSHELSNKLARGEIDSFAEAMQAVALGMQAEHNETVTWNASLAPNEQDLKWNHDALDHYGEIASEAQRVYGEAMRRMEAQLVEAFRLKAKLTNTPEWSMIADALESGDYSPLAW